MKDLFGKAILDYQTKNNPKNLLTETSISEPDEMNVAYLFRNYNQMPKIEQKALQETKGKTLDVGCGAGSHSLYLQNNGIDVTAIDISKNAIEACKLRGIKKAYAQDVMNLQQSDKFDTILLLMNGAGMCGKLNKITTFLQQLKKLLTPNGQILLDSSDIIYMFDNDNDGGKWIPGNVDYYGEVIFTVHYKNETETPFNWLYIDYNTLTNAATSNGFNCELLTQGEHYDYLAKLTLKK